MDLTAPQQFVRLIHDVSRIGITTGESRPHAGRKLIAVRFSNGVQFVPCDQLELVPPAVEPPVALLEAGRFAEPARLRQVLTHIRLTGRLADLIYSMEATNTDFHAYQFKSVLKILNAPAGGLLIAETRSMSAVRLQPDGRLKRGVRPGLTQTGNSPPRHIIFRATRCWAVEQPFITAPITQRGATAGQNVSHKLLRFGALIDSW